MADRFSKPNLGSPKGFMNILKSISVAEISKEANRPLSVAIVGEPAVREEAIRALYVMEDEADDGSAPKSRALPASPFVQSFDSTTEAAHFPQANGIFDFVIDVGGGRQDVPEGTRIYSVAELGGWNETLSRILEDRPELALPLARNFPVFRRRVAQKIVTATASANAQFALVTGLATSVPILEPLLPGSALSDIVILTKNQIMMTLRLAAAYGLDVDYKSRSKELLPILGNAFGWRAIARELIGFVPFGVGLIARASIAYAGTVTVGKAAQYYYETGENVTKAQLQQLYKDAYEGSKEKVRALADAIKGGRGGGGGHRKRIAPKAPDVINAVAPETAPASLPESEPVLDTHP